MKYLSLVTLLIIIGCGASLTEQEESSTELTASNAVSTAQDAVESIEFEMNSSEVNAASIIRAGIGVIPKQASSTDENCSDNGDPYANNSEVSVDDEGFGALKGYCAAVFNTRSPDSVLGGMFLSSIVSCLAGENNAFTSGASNVSVTFTLSEANAENTDCYTAAEVASLLEGSTEVSVSTVVNDVSATTDYEYSFTVDTGDSEENTFYVKASSTQLATTSVSGDGVWSFNFLIDGTDAVLYYENVDTRYRRIRLRVTGTVSGSGSFSFTDITNIVGWNLETNGDGESEPTAWTSFSTFYHVPGDGTQENVYKKDSSIFTAVREDNCYDQASPPATCSEQRFDYKVSESQIDTLFSGISSSDTSYRSSMNSKIPSFGIEPGTSTDHIFTNVLTDFADQ